MPTMHVGHRGMPCFHVIGRELCLAYARGLPFDAPRSDFNFLGCLPSAWNLRPLLRIEHPLAFKINCNCEALPSKDGLKK